MNNQIQTTKISHEIYQKHHIFIEYVQSNTNYYWVGAYTPQAWARQTKNFAFGHAHNLEQAEAYVASIKAKIDQRVKEKQDRLAEKAKAREEFVNPYKVGDILYGSWGYDQTNIDFFQIVGVGNRSLKIREIGGRVVETTSHCSERVEPIKDKFVKDEIHRVNLVINTWGGKGGHTIKSPVHGNLYKHQGGTHHSSWGH